MATLVAFLVGLLFAIGLGLGGMTQPGRVVGFLDILGAWNPSLVFVMAGALAIHTVLYRIIRKRPSPLLADRFQIPSRRDIDPSLVVGASLFGIGWGLAGFCPAPAITSLASLQTAPVIFVASMIAGMFVFEIVHRRS